MNSRTFLPPTLDRRQALALLAASPLLARAQDAGNTVRIGQSIALSGPLGDLGMAVHLGAKACFEQVNAKGGVEGRLIELVSKDDAYDLKKSQANVDELVADKSLLALFNCFGTPMVESLLPKAQQADLPVFAPYTGALSVRANNPRSVVHLRASYADEVAKMVEHLSTLGTKRVAVAYQNNSFGKEVADAAQKAMDKHGLKSLVTATVENDASDATAAAAKLAGAEPEAVLLGLAGKPALELIRQLRAKRRGATIYALSVMGAAGTVKALGADGVGVAVSQVVPMPTNVVVSLVRDFQQAWKALNVEQAPSHTALEGYVNARAFTEALRRAGRNPSRAAFVDAVWKLRRLDLGGLELNFTEPGVSASKFVELTIIGREGRFMR